MAIESQMHAQATTSHTSLIGLTGPHYSLLTKDGQRIHISCPAFRIGRDEECQLRISQRGVSGHHVTIHVCDEAVSIRDENSKNGTFIDGALLAPGGEATLEVGARLRISKSAHDEFELVRSDGRPTAVPREGRRRPETMTVVMALNAYLTEPEVLEHYLDLARGLVDADRALLLDTEQNVLAGRVSPRAVGANLDLTGVSRRTLVRVLQSGRTAEHVDLGECQDVGLRESVGDDIHALLCVPLIIRETADALSARTTVVQEDRVVAALYLDRRAPIESFSREDRESMEILADHAAIAIERSRLHKHLVAAAEKEAAINKELALAASIQRSLLPAELSVPSFAEAYAINRSADATGGDFYDCFTIDDHLFGLTIGDVCGHGMAAAVLMATIQATFWNAVGRRSPGEVMTEVARVMRDRVPPGRFVTACYATLHQSGLLTCVSAGHPVPIVVRAGGGLEELCVEGPVIGVPALIDDDVGVSPYGERWTRLERGDLVLFHTDGLLDALDAAQRSYGIEKLKTALGAATEHQACQTIVNRLVADVADHRKDQPLSDDLTLLALRYRGS